jgi:hypothetical protein
VRFLFWFDTSRLPTARVSEGEAGGGGVAVADHSEPFRFVCSGFGALLTRVVLSAGRVGPLAQLAAERDAARDELALARAAGSAKGGGGGRPVVVATAMPPPPGGAPPPGAPSCRLSFW